MSLETCKEKLRALRTEEGYGNFDAAVKALNRERVNVNRDERKDKYPKRYYQILFDRQKGICPYCGKHLFVPATRGNEIDHIDPNRTDFNHPTNLELLHGVPCNREKSSKDVFQQSKESGKMVSEILKPGFIGNESEENGVGL
jgi:CRISPR/Cas system Type II protein with McrA/HNH and RuvC-like nuclease domain